MLFERQEYQEDCVSNILQVLDSLESNEGQAPVALLQEAVRRLQHERKMAVGQLKDDLRLDILMETGTGKTFTYLKAMYEMNRRHGKNKFLIFVPRLAIRAGIIQNIDLTADYFFQEYGKRLKRYAYGSKGGLNQVESYIRNEHEFSVLILTSASIAGRRRDKILTRFNETLYGAEAPLAAIGALDPVVFVDEPHLLQGPEFIGAYRDYFAGSLLLRFGATFPEGAENEISNVVYTLDSINAFRDHLVKRISVSTVTDAGSTLKFYRSGNRQRPISLHFFKHGIERKADISLNQNLSSVTGDKAHSFHVLRLAGSRVLCSDHRERTLSSETYEISDDTMRDMVRETIEIHFQKEARLFAQGIKALSLFFIPGIADFRAANPRIKAIFEDEYKQQRTQIMQSSLSREYREYLQRDYDAAGNLCVHEGYFAGDKGSQEQGVADGIDIILNDKERLLSTQEPLRFIFSVWALQEGWDNPNIFTICKLAASPRETSRRQQVGRGLRLAVDCQGQRQTIRHCQDAEQAFYSINTLDVVVSGQEDRFIEGIQQEIVNGSLTSDRLTREALQKLGLNGDQIADLVVWLRSAGLIRLDENEQEAWHILGPVADFLLAHRDDPPESLKGQHDLLVQAFANAFRSPVENRKRATEKVRVRDDKFKEFEGLWHTITRKAEIVYRDIDDGQVIQAVKQSFADATIPPVARSVEKRSYDPHSNQIVFEKHKSLGDGATFTDDEFYEFVMNFASREMLPLAFCVELFNQLDREKIRGNPKRAYEVLAAAVKEHIHQAAVGSVDYRFDREQATANRQVFYEEGNPGKPKKWLEASALGKYPDDDFPPADNYLYDRIVFDSGIEREVAAGDPQQVDGKEVAVFAKLPRISIPTPYKSYNPDFAYCIYNAAGKDLYLVTETKGFDLEQDIPADEMKKIEYGERFFEALNRTETDTQVVFTKRIKAQPLSQLLPDTGERE